MKNTNINTQLSIFISLAALVGVALHDTKLDRLATSVMSTIPIALTVTAGLTYMRSDDHTHVDRVTVNDLSGQAPRIMPRNGEQKKHMMQKRVPKGNRSFDGYCMPMV